MSNYEISAALALRRDASQPDSVAQAWSAYEAQLRPVVERLQDTTIASVRRFIPASQLAMLRYRLLMPLMLSRPFVHRTIRQFTAPDLIGQKT